MEKKEVESKTADLFPRIHLETTKSELDYFRKTVIDQIAAYTKHFNVSDIVRDTDVLDVGCGGRASGIYALQNFHPKSFTGIDLSEKNVENSRKICSALEYSNVTIEQGNALKLDFPDKSFDFVYSNGVIMITTNTYQCFLELVRVLKPGGHLFLAVYGYGGLWGRVIHPLGMLAGKVIPLSIAEKFVNKTGFLKSAENSLLDWFYAPIQENHKAKEIVSWFQNNGLENVLRVKSPKWFYNLGILTSILFGDGYVVVVGRKK